MIEDPFQIKFNDIRAYLSPLANKITCCGLTDSPEFEESKVIPGKRSRESDTLEIESLPGNVTSGQSQS
jgi:hypothetical protein